MEPVNTSESISCISEYLEQVNAIITRWEEQWTDPKSEFFNKGRGKSGETSDSSDEIWFRGNDDIYKQPLIPTLYRNLPANGKTSEREINRDFYLKSAPFLSHSSDNNNNWDTMFAARHHGLPSRLLDWTEGSLIGLFFAVRKNPTVTAYKNTDCEVYVFNPRFLNTRTVKHGIGNGLFALPDDKNNKKRGEIITQNTLLAPGHPWLEKYLLPNIKLNIALENSRKPEAQYPIPIRANYVSSRIVSQRGVFTIYGNIRKSINELREEPLFTNLQLEEIRILGKDKGRILKELYDAGISESTLFPEIDAVARDVTYYYRDYS